MADKKKLNVVSIVILALLAVALIMGIVGISSAWLTTALPESMGGKTGTDTIKDLMDANELAGGKMLNGLEAIQAFSIISIIAAGLTAVSYAVSKFVNIKALKFVTIACAAVLVICALLALIFTFTCTNTDYCEMIKKAGAKFSPAIGCWLLSIFGMVGGAAGVYGGLKG